MTPAPPATHRPFRFGIHVNWANSPEEFCQKACQAERLGYASFTVADHFGRQYAWLPAVMAAGMKTETLRVGPLVASNDYKHAVVFAKEIATADILLGGRVLAGIGAGWLHDDYDRSGITFDPPSTRIARLEESLIVLQGLWSGEPFSFDGRFHHIDSLSGTPLPHQRPHPPIMMGAGGKKMLSLAARYADIINISVNQRAGQREVATVMSVAENQEVGINRQRIEWIRQAAPERFDEIELSAMCFVIPADDRAEVVAKRAHELGITEADLLDSPQWLIGTRDEMICDLHRRRELFGISYVVFFDEVADFMAPVVQALSGT